MTRKLLIHYFQRTFRQWPLAFMAVVIAATQAASANPVPAVDFLTPEVDYNNDISWSLGFEFTVYENVSAVSLGFYDSDANGFLEDHSVGLFDNYGNLLAEALISNSSVLNGLFRWESIAPVSLLAGETYVVAGYAFLDSYTWNPYDAYTDSRIFIPAARYADAEALVFPEFQLHEVFGFFGPNLMLADLSEPPSGVPTPSADLLFLVGLISLIWRRKNNDWRLYYKRVLAPPIIPSIFLASPANALELSATPVQGNSTWAGQLPLGSRYDRYSHDNTGVIAEYDNPFDHAGNYIVPVGEVLRWVWLRNDVSLGFLEYQYVGGTDHCWVSSTGARYCGTFNRFLAFNHFKCRPEHGEYQLLLFRSGTEVLRHQFDTERFKIKKSTYSWSIPNQFRPKSAGGDGGGVGETKELTIKVTDDLDCGQPLEDVQLTTQATLVPGTNNHQHFGADRYGTGQFLPSPGHHVERSEHDTKVVGRTNSRGEFRVRYQAMDYAITERVSIELLRPAEHGFPEDKYETMRQWDIKWPLIGEFASFDFSPHTWDYTPNGLACHGSQDTQATSMLLDVGDQLAQSLDGYYTFAGGYYLSLNDASFPWGGIVDSWGDMDGGTGACDHSHISHRTGKDIDINRRDKQGRVIMNLDGTPADNYEGSPLLILLDRQMEQAGFNRVIEDTSIHYRYAL